MRGDRHDFDQWAEMVGDERYSYDGMLPYFIQVEEYFDASVTPGEHGSDGPIYAASVTSTGREYPLRGKLAKTWDETGVKKLDNLDANAGPPPGPR